MMVRADESGCAAMWSPTLLPLGKSHALRSGATQISLAKYVAEKYNTERPCTCFIKDKILSFFICKEITEARAQFQGHL